MIDASAATRSRQLYMKICYVCLPIVMIAGCASTAQPEIVFEEPAIANTREAQLADATARELAHLARFDPEFLPRVSEELRALATALVVQGNLNQEALASTMDDAHLAASPGELAPPPGFMADAPSLRHGIHLASYRLRENAESGWWELKARFPAVLDNLEPRLEMAQIRNQGEFLRLKAGPYDSANEAISACAALESVQAFCQPVDFSGQPLTDSGSEAHH